MASKSIKCSVELKIRSVSSPGMWMKERGDIYVAVEMLGQTRETNFSSPIFPLIFHDELHFEKDFVLAYDLAQVVDYLTDEYVRIELIQTNKYDGTLLAWYESPLTTFLYPSPGLSSPSSSAHGLYDREILMERSLAFTGISPRLEFSTKTVIKDTNVNFEDYMNDDLGGVLKPSTRRSRSRSRTRDVNGRSKSPRQKSYENLTVSSALKMMKPEIADDARNENGRHVIDDRPPFVVRKIDDDLINRKPSPLAPRPLSRSPERSRHLSPLKTSRFNNTSSGATNGYTGTSNKFDDNTSRDHAGKLARRSWSPSRLESIRSSIDRALRRNKSLERLEQLDRLNRTRYYYNTYRYWPYYYDYIDELEFELEMARRRLRYL